MARKQDFPKDSEALEKIAERINPDKSLSPGSMFDSTLMKEFVYLIVTVQKKGLKLVPTPSRNPVRSSILLPDK